jgi:hypothetical protein
VSFALPSLLKLSPVPGRSLEPFARQPVKLLPLPVQVSEGCVRHQAEPSLPRNSTSKSIEPESSMAMIRFGCTPEVRNSGVSLMSSGAASAPLPEKAVSAAITPLINVALSRLFRLRIS